MQIKTTLGGYSTIPEFVEAKLCRYREMDHTFESLFEMMFSEKENIMYEKSVGYKIEYTSYGKAYSQAKSSAMKLKSILSGFEHDAVVGLYMDNDVSWIVSFWAILAAGFRPLLLNIRLGDEIIDRVIENMSAIAVVSDGKEFPNLITINSTELMDTEGISPSESQPEGTPFGTEILVMSSGTTNFPKVCAYNGEAFFYQVSDTAVMIKQNAQVKKHYNGSLKLLTFLPFYHVFGLFAVYMWFAFFSRTFVHLADFSSNTVLNTIRRHEVTHIFAVPMFWNTVYSQAMKTISGRGEETAGKFAKGLALAEKLGDVPLLGNLLIKAAFKEVRENLFGDSICFLISGGSEISEEVLRFFNYIGYPLANGYGSTEIGITSVELSARRKVRSVGYVGKPLQSVEYKINENGELLVRGKTMAHRIFAGDEITEGGQWFNTHDLAEYRDGRYFIGGRRDDLVISETGENLNPNVIEPLVRKDLAAEVALIGPKENGKVIPTLLVGAGKVLTEAAYEQIRAKVVGNLAENQLSSQIQRLVITQDPIMYPDEIKLNRSCLKKDYEKGLIQEATPKKAAKSLSEESTAIAYIRKLFAVALNKGEEELDADADFFLDYGGSSLDYFAILAKCKEDYSISFPTSENGSLNSINGLGEYIEKLTEHVD